MALLVVLTLLSALNGVQPSVGFAFHAKPLELSRLDNEYCEYGLSRRPPHKWCICWGRIDTRVEVLPWDCSTRAPKFLSRKKRHRNSEWELENFLRGLNTRNNLFPQDLLKDDHKLKMPPLKFHKQKQPKQSVLTKAVTTLFKEMGGSGDNSLMDAEFRYLLVPFFHSYFGYVGNTNRNASPLSGTMSALKLLLHQVESARNIYELEEALMKDVALLRFKFFTVKNSVIADLEELLKVVKDFPGNQSVAARKEPLDLYPEGNFRDFKMNQIAPDEKQEPKTVSESPKIPKFRTESHDAKPEKVPPMLDRFGLNMILKLGSPRNYSKMAEVLGETVAKAIGLEESPKNVSEFESAERSIPVRIAEIQDFATESAGKSSAEPKVQVPKNRTQPEPLGSSSDNSGRLLEIATKYLSMADKSLAEVIGPNEIPKNVSKLDSASRSSLAVSIGEIQDSRIESAEKSSAELSIGEIQDSRIESAEKSSAEPDVQVPKNLTQPESLDSNSDNPEKLLEGARNYSSMANKSLVGGWELDSASRSSVGVSSAEIQGSTTESSEKSSAEPEIQVPANLSHSELVNPGDIGNNRNNATPEIENSPRAVHENHSEFTERYESSFVDAVTSSTDSSKLENASSPNLQLNESSSEIPYLEEIENQTYRPRPDSRRYWE